MTKFEIRVPCSSANLGPGFDALGLALSLYLYVEVQALDSDEFEIVILEATQGLSLEPEVNLLTQMITQTLTRYGKSPKKKIKLKIKSEIPFGSGLGSSSTAIIAAVMIANQVGDLHLNRDALLDICCEIEGHPDNICPGFLGNLTVSVYSKPCIYLTISFPEEIKIMAATPSYQLPTEKARQVLPNYYSREDVVFNIQRASALPHILSNPSYWNRLKDVLQDKIHQPFRLSLLPGFETVLRIEEEGCLGAFVSGAGPTALILYLNNEEKIEQFVRDAFSKHGFTTTVRHLKVDVHGALLTMKSQ
eukprot:NODE_67_length_23829_cov_0.557059.p10 type:complete len:305 gc:universal NODE_67_length_23829_cov_0.557059:11386-12300(+)